VAAFQVFPTGRICLTGDTVSASLVHPREVFKPAIRHGAFGIFLVHNHHGS
jgi:DNA repair protein RadC